MARIDAIELSEEVVGRMPKVLLHEHLDGGPRPATLLEIAEQERIALPESDPVRLAAWFHRGAGRGSLPLYLEGFAATIAVMQSKAALARIAYEAILDAAAENIVYVELRFHPGFHTQRGLTLEDVMNAVLAGCARGERETGVQWGLLVCAMRSMDPAVSLEMAELAVAYRDKGVVGFDLAGDESGHPPKKHIDAFHSIQRANFSITVHAGEAFGKDSIWQAIQWCGAHRIGHAVRLVEVLALDEHGKVVAMGALAQYVLDKRIPLEVCLLSNLQTGACPSLEDHPFPLFWRYRFRVTVNTDNRLMSDTSLTKELWTIARTCGLTFDDLEKITINSIKSAFISYRRRCALIYNVIKPRMSQLRTELED